VRIRSLQLLWGLSTSLTVIGLLAGCGSNGSSSSGSSTSETSTTTSAAPATTSTLAAPPSTPAAQTKTWVDLQVGECIAEVPAVEQGAVTATIVDCAVPHAAEVFLRAPTAVNEAIADIANQECVAGLPAYTGRSVEGSPFAVTYLIDSNQDRTSNNPLPSTVICLLQAANGQPLTESGRR
jgi:hypothetical protein